MMGVEEWQAIRVFERGVLCENRVSSLWGLG